MNFCIMDAYRVDTSMKEFVIVFGKDLSHGKIGKFQHKLIFPGEHAKVKQRDWVIIPIKKLIFVEF